MGKKATVKDVAREAGVSAATVSYIMNNRTDMKISEATRKKVLQIANLLDYTPSHAAKSLATGRNNIIGISYHLNDNTPCRNIEITSFVNLLIRRLNRLKYDVLFMPVQSAGISFSSINVDGVITVDLTESEFSVLSNNSMVPIINTDMIINDPLFYQICTDYPRLIREGADYLKDDFYIITDRFANEKYSEVILSGIDSDHIIFFSEDNDERLKSIGDSKVIILNEYLALMTLPYTRPDNTVVISSGKLDYKFPDKVKIIEKDISKKANLAINILLNALDKKFDIDHVYMV